MRGWCSQCTRCNYSKCALKVPHGVWGLGYYQPAVILTDRNVSRCGVHVLSWDVLV